ncbi:MAG: succinate dehydrogenase/fumarate reductase iron-sulfur subunit [Acidobacteriota bacterium]|nr:MAG: succinate dehydrogenase/fumarate reductase iron-sulfur subunit [Acidobacteriota bacterium]
MSDLTLRLFRGDAQGGEIREYRVPVEEGMVVLDAVLRVQSRQSNELACRWNCKAGKCGSCSAEVNGRPRLMCMTRLDLFPEGEPLTVTPIKTFPVIRDLATDVSWNFETNKRITPFTPKADADWKFFQHDVERAQEFRKCIECFLCQNVCHVLRDHDLKDAFMGPRFLVRTAGLEMHPLDVADRLRYLKDEGGIGYCNITKCCTEVCPEKITITDNAIIALKERVVDRFYDPLTWLWRLLTGRRSK